MGVVERDQSLLSRTQKDSRASMRFHHARQIASNLQSFLSFHFRPFPIPWFLQ